MMSPRPSDEPESFFNEPPSDWARVKHAVLKHYLRVFLYKLQRASSAMLIVDGFAGCGIYSDGSDGSPVIAAKFNDDPGLVRVGARVHVVAIEEHDEARRSLVRALAPWTAPPQRAWVEPGPFSDHIVDIASRSEQLPTFVFLDPFGMSDLTVAELAPLLASGRNAPLELLIRVDATLLARFAGQVASAHENPDRQGVADAFATLLQRMQIDPELAVQLIENAGPPDERREHLLASYANAFKARFRFVQFVPIRPAHNAAPKYFLMHATDSQHGYVAMNDVASKLMEQQEAAHDTVKYANQTQIDAFGPVPGGRVSLHAVDQSIIDDLRARGSSVAPEFIELRVGLVQRFGDRLRQKDHDAALKRLAKAGRVVVDRSASPKGYDRARVRLA